MKARNQLSKDKPVCRYGPRNKEGSMLVLVVSCVIVLIVLGIFALNYNHIFQQNLVGKTAAESAALQYVQDMARVVVNVADKDDLGNPITVPMALVDQVPQNVTDNGCTKPVLGVNTRLATIRMTMVAAAQLGNAAMLYAAQHDYDDLVNCQIPAFNKALQDPTSWKDVNGNPIDAVGDAKAAFKNNLRAGNNAASLVDDSFSATIGFSNSSSAVYTGTPVTNSTFDSAISQNQDKYSLVGAGGTRVYKAYNPIPVSTANASIYSGEGTFSFPTISQTFEFAAIADAPSLVPNNSFQPSGDTNDPWAPPAIVQVTAKETMGNAGGTSQPQTMTETATAEVGGTLQNYPSGGLCFGFPDGLPGNTNMFNTVLSIINWSQPHGALTADTPAPFFGWNQNSVGHWFEATGGPIGASLSGTKPNGNFLHTHTFKGRNQHDDPSIACSFALYDWLKTLGPRVNLDSLASNLQMGAGNSNVAAIKTPYLTNATVVASASEQPSQNIAWIPEARAQASGAGGTADGYTEGIGVLPGKFPGDNSKMNQLTGGSGDDGMKDTRFILNHGQSVSFATDNRTAAVQNHDQTALAFGDLSHKVVAPASAINLLIAADGTTTTASGAPFTEIVDYTKALAGTNANATTSAANAKAALGDVSSNLSTDTAAIASDVAALSGKLPAPKPVPAPVTDSKGNVTNQAAIDAANSFNSNLAGLSSDLQAISKNNQSVTGLNGQSPSYSVSDGLAFYANAINASAASAISHAGAVGVSTALLQDIQAKAQGSTANPPSDIKAQGTVMKRALYVKNNALYVNKVIVTINANDKALTGQGLNEGSDATHFKLAGQDFWPIAGAATKDQIEGSGSITTKQNSGDPGVMDWTSSSKSIDGTQSNLIVYKYPGATKTPAPLPGVNIGSLLQPAYAQASTVPASNRRMIVMGQDPTGNIWTLVTAHTPYAQTSLLDGQYIYQDTLAYAQPITGGNNTYWLMETRDLNASGSGDYFADGSGTNGNVENPGWCKDATYIGATPPLNMVNGIQAECQHVAAEIRLSCPVSPASCQVINSVNLDGSAGAAVGSTCPPPPPCGS